MAALVDLPNRGKILWIGQMHVAAIDSLLLSPIGDTAAECAYTLHIDYNDYGRILKNATEATEHHEAEFRKQPDGTWACLKSGLPVVDNQ
jgi:hypothetical protein